MFAEALALPFQFFRRRPIFTLSCLFIQWALSFGVDVIVGPLSNVRYAHVSDGPLLAFPWKGLLYDAFKITLTSWPMAYFAARVLLDVHGRSPERKPSATDGFRWLVLSLIYLVVISSPLAMLLNIPAQLLVRAYPQMTSFQLSILWAVFYRALDALILLRFAFAWPHALATGNIGLFRSWRITRNRYLQVVGALLPIYILVSIFLESATHAYYNIRIELRAGLLPARVTTSAFIDAIYVITGSVQNVAVIAIYPRLRPISVTQAAEVFS